VVVAGGVGAAVTGGAILKAASAGAARRLVRTVVVFVHAYTPAGLTLLALAGLAIAVIGALGPAAWAATSRTTTALHAE